MTAPPVLEATLGEGFAADKEEMEFNEALKRGEEAQARIDARSAGASDSRGSEISARPFSITEAARNVASDIGRGIPEIPLKLVAGAVETITADPVDLLADIVGVTGVADPTILENAATATREFISSATAGEPETVTGEFAELTGNFLTAFIPVLGQVSKGGPAATVAGKINMNAVAGMVADFLTTDTDESTFKERLEATRLGALAGVGLDRTVAFLRSVRIARRARKAAVKGPKAEAGALVDEPRITDEQVRLTENADAPLLGERQTPGEKALVQAEKDIQARAGDEPVDPEALRRMAEVETATVDINFDRINSSDDAKELLRQATEAFSSSVDASRRGVRSNEATQEAADRLGLSLEEVLSRRKGVALNAEEAVAFRKVWGSAANKLEELAQKASGLDGAASDLDQIKFRKMLAVFHAINKEVLGARAEAGRALQSWSINVGGDVERARVISSLLDANGGAEVSGQLARRIALAQKMGMSAAQISHIAERGWAAKTLDMVKEAYVLGLLWTPSTHAVNIASNTIVPFQQILERSVARGIARVTGEQADSVVAGEGLVMLKALVKGVRAAAHIGAQGRELREKALRGIAGARSKLDVRTGAISAEAWGIDPDNGWGKFLDYYGSATRAPGNALQVADNFFKTIGFTVELEAQALRQATKEGVQNGWNATQIALRKGEIVKNPPENIGLAAADAAIYNTFQGDVGKIGKAVMKFRDAVPPAFLQLPFIRTPMNLLRYTFERSPIAPLVGQWRADVAAGGARAEIALARMATGSAMFMAYLDYAYEGHISGPPSRDPGLRDARRRQGMQASEIRFGDNSFKINRVDPFGMQMTTAAGIAEVMKLYQVEEEDLPELTEILGAASVVMSDAVLDKTWFTGVNEAVSLMSNPERRGPRFIEQKIQGLIPFSSLIRTASSLAGETRPGSAGWLHVQSMIDGFQQSLPRRKDLWGRNIEVDVVNVFSPARIDKVEENAIDTEILRLGLNQQRIPRTTSFDGATVNFRQFPRVYEAYVELAGNGLEHPATGQGAFDFLQDLVSGKSPFSTTYEMGSDGPDGRKSSEIRRWISRYRELAQREIMLDPDGRFQSDEFDRFREAVDAGKERKRELRMPVLQ